ncbi:MAG: permease-like cell division protein FtsX [Bacillota bacterium]
MRLRTTKYFIKEGLSNLRRNKIMSAASITSVIAALLVIGIFFIIVLNVDYAASALEAQVEMAIYLSDNLSESIISAMGEEIKGIDGVKEVVFISKAVALENMKQKLGENSYLLEGLEEDNPLPDSFVVTLMNPEKASSVALALSSMSNIEKVSYGKNELEKLLKATYVLRMTSVLIIVILLFISVFIISNTIKLTVFARRREIGIMKFVGATDWFVRAPFIVEGILLGIVGALTSTALLGLGYFYTISLIKKQMIGFFALSLMPFKSIILSLIVLLVFIGIIIGALGSLLSVRRFIKV